MDMIMVCPGKATEWSQVNAQLVDSKHEDALNTAQEALRAAQETEDRRMGGEIGQKPWRCFQHNLGLFKVTCYFPLLIIMTWDELFFSRWLEQIQA